MSKKKLPGNAQEYDTEEGLSLALAYLADPADVPCPRCGPGTVEVVCYLDAIAMEDGRIEPKTPDEDYTVILYCHDCGRAAALDLSRDAESSEVGEEDVA